MFIYNQIDLIKSDLNLIGSILKDLKKNILKKIRMDWLTRELSK
jgi:hypothetical protein